MKIQLVLTLLMVSVVFSQYDKYCELESCPNHTHTLCKYSRFRYGNNCKRILMLEIPVHQRKHIVNYHNYLRYPNLYDEPEYLVPQTATTDSATLPNLFQWDDELALIAQWWANQCERIVDECRNVDRFAVTQFIDVNESFEHETRPSIFTSIRRWYYQEDLEIENPQTLNSDAGSDSTLNRDETSNREEISGSTSRREEFSNSDESSSSTTSKEKRLNNISEVWRSANRVGCGLIRTFAFQIHRLYFVCNYGFNNKSQE